MYSNPFSPQHQYASSPYRSQEISSGDEKEDLFNNDQVRASSVGDHSLYIKDVSV